MSTTTYDNSTPYRRVVVTFRVAEFEHHLFRAAAARSGVSVSQFLRRSAHEALRRELILSGADAAEAS